MNAQQWWSEPPELTIEPGRTYAARLETTRGPIDVDLWAQSSPRTVNNFVFLARQGFYDGVVFHRVIEGFIVQGGDPTGTGTGGPGYQFEDELTAAREHGYPRGTLAMANAGPDTNGSQFFVVHQDAPLPPDYSVFGRVSAGMETVDAIAGAPTGPDDRPVEDVVIRSVSVSES